jgi:hypothetical protein
MKAYFLSKYGSENLEYYYYYYFVVVVVSCHKPFLSGTSLEPTTVPTTQTSSFRLRYCQYYV